MKSQIRRSREGRRRAAHNRVAEGDVHLREAHGNEERGSERDEEDLEVLLVILSKNATDRACQLRRRESGEGQTHERIAVGCLVVWWCW